MLLGGLSKQIPDRKEAPRALPWENSPVIGKGIWNVRLLCLGLEANVAARHSIPAGPHSTRFAYRHRTPIVIEDVDVVIGSGATDGQAIPNNMLLHGVDNGRLRRATAVPVNCMFGP